MNTYIDSIYQFHQQPLPLQLHAQQVYVFDSMHYAAGDSTTARHALQHYGALPRVGRGWSGQSFALPICDTEGKLLAYPLIEQYIQDFKIYTAHHRDFVYYVAGLDAQLTPSTYADIAAMFCGISDNVIFPIEFKPFLSTNSHI